MPPRRRRKGSGSVFYSKAERVWIARITVDGHRHKARSATERGARRELEELRRRYAAATVADTLEEYLGRWLSQHRRPRASTMTSYEGHVRLHIVPELGQIPVTLLTPADVDRLIARKLAEGKSPATVSRIVTTLRVALGAGVKRGELPRNVASLVDLPKAEERPVKAMTHDEGDRIVEAFRGHWAQHVIEVLHGSGMRLGEALSLNQGDLFLDEGYVRLRTSKTRLRTVFVNDDAVEAFRAALAEAKRRGPDEPVFTGPKTADRMRGSSVSHAVPRVLEAAGLGRMTVHGFRHGLATRMLLDGVPMREISEQLGHASPALTARTYAHVVPESLRRHVDATSRKSRRQA
jgi:integrase